MEKNAVLPRKFEREYVRTEKPDYGNALKIATAFNKHKIPYMIIGGQAVLIHRKPRATKMQ